MPLPSLLSISLATGILAALAGRGELRVSPRPTPLTQSFIAYCYFAGFVLVPISAYFYIFHGDWFLLYLIDTRRIPSAAALVAFTLQGGLGALGFVLGAALIRVQRDAVAVGLGIVFVMAAAALVSPFHERLSVVGSYAQYRGSFGLSPYASGALLRGTVVMSTILIAAFVGLIVRLSLGDRRS